MSLPRPRERSESRVRSSVRVASLTVSLLLVAVACGDDGAESSNAAASETSTTLSSTTVTTTGPATTLPSTTGPPAGTGFEVRDTTPPVEARNLTCGPGAGSGELSLEWDAPEDPDDVAVVRVYFQEGTGGFGSIGDYALSDGAVTTDLAASTRWSVTAVGVPATTPMDLGVALLDAEGNESGFTPIDAYLAFAGADCEMGPPPAPTIVEVRRGAGSLEVDLVITPTATDVVEFAVEADVGEGFAPLEVVATQPSVDPPDVVVVAVGADWSVETSYRIRAIDAHGFLSVPGQVECSPLVPDSTC